MTGEHCEEVLRVTTCTFLQHSITHMTPIQTHHSASWYQPEHEAGGGIGRYRKASEQVPGNIVILESHWNLGSNRTQTTWKQPFYRAQHLSNTSFTYIGGPTSKVVAEHVYYLQFPLRRRAWNGTNSPFIQRQKVRRERKGIKKKNNNKVVLSYIFFI